MVIVTYPAIGSEKYRIGFDIAVNNPLRVQECKCLKTLKANGGDLFLVHSSVRDNVRECASFEVLHHYPEFISYKETIVHLDNVWMMVVTHDHHLIQTVWIKKL